MGLSLGLGLGLTRGGGPATRPLSALNPHTLLLPNAGLLWKEIDGSRATPAAADGDLVGQARDAFTPTKYHTAASLAARPTLRISGGKRWLECDGADDDLLTFDFPVRPFVLAAAARYASGAGRLLNGAGANWLLGPFGSAFAYYANGFVYNAAGDTADHVHVGTGPIGSSRYRLDGVDLTTDATPVGTPTAIHVGGGVGALSAGRCYGLVVLDYTPSGADLAFMESELAKLYAGLS